MEEKVIKLIQSTIDEDLLIGLGWLVRNKKYEEIIEFLRPYRSTGCLPHLLRIKRGENHGDWKAGRYNNKCFYFNSQNLDIPLTPDSETYRYEIIEL